MNNPLFQPFQPAAQPQQGGAAAPAVSDAEVTNAPKGKRARKTTEPKAPRKLRAAKPAAQPGPLIAATANVIHVNAVMLLQIMEALKAFPGTQEAFLGCLNIFQGLSPDARILLSNALADLFPPAE